MKYVIHILIFAAFLLWTRIAVAQISIEKICEFSIPDGNGYGFKCQNEHGNFWYLSKQNNKYFELTKLSVCNEILFTKKYEFQNTIYEIIVKENPKDGTLHFLCHTGDFSFMYIVNKDGDFLKMFSYVEWKNINSFEFIDSGYVAVGEEIVYPNSISSPYYMETDTNGVITKGKYSSELGKYWLVKKIDENYVFSQMVKAAPINLRLTLETNSLTFINEDFIEYAASSNITATATYFYVAIYRPTGPNEIFVYNRELNIRKKLIPDEVGVLFGKLCPIGDLSKNNILFLSTNYNSDAKKISLVKEISIVHDTILWDLDEIVISHIDSYQDIFVLMGKSKTPPYEYRFLKFRFEEKDEIDSIIVTNTFVYPNPALDYITINVPDTSSSVFNLTIFNENGNAVYSKRYTTNVLHVDTKAFSPGLYLLSVKASTIKKPFTEKVLIQRKPD